MGFYEYDIKAWLGRDLDRMKWWQVEAFVNKASVTKNSVGWDELLREVLEDVKRPHRKVGV
jgi:hypothetical protein